MGAGTLGWAAGVVAANPRLGKLAIMLDMLEVPVAAAGFGGATKQYLFQYVHTEDKECAEQRVF